MKIKEFVSNAPVKIMSSMVIIPFLSTVAMVTHSPFGLTSPYFAAIIYYALQTLIMMLYMVVDDDFDGNYSPKILVRMSRILSPIKIVTAIAIISFANLKDAPVPLLAFVLLFTVWLLATGVTGIVCHWVLPMYQALMQNRTATKATRSEVALIKDLDQYLSKVDIS